MLKFATTAALVATLAFTSAAPAHAWTIGGIVSSAYKSLTGHSACCQTIDYVGPRWRPANLGGTKVSMYAKYSTLPSQTQDAIRRAQMHLARGDAGWGITQIKGPDGTRTAGYLINGTVYPGPRWGGVPSGGYTTSDGSYTNDPTGAPCNNSSSNC